MYIVTSGFYDTNSKYWEEGTKVEELPPGANPAKVRLIEEEKRKSRRKVGDG